MNTLVATQLALVTAVIQEAGIPALRIAFTIAVIIFLFGGFEIFRRRHQFFDSDPTVEYDIPVVRHNREIVIGFVWAGLTLVLISIMYQVWRA